MEMDNTLIAGIMTSIATLIAAFITVYSVRKVNSNLEDDDKYSVFNKTYTILHRDTDNSTIIVKDGFSWPAAVFHVCWLFFKGLWEAIFVIILIFGGVFLHFYVVDLISGVNFLEYYIAFINATALFFVIILGAFGNRLIVRKYTHSICLLDNRTYKAVDSVVATTKANALLKHMEKHNYG